MKVPQQRKEEGFGRINATSRTTTSRTHLFLESVDSDGTEEGADLLVLVSVAFSE